MMAISLVSPAEQIILTTFRSLPPSVLCAYLGQLVKIRDAMQGEVAVVIEGRDAENIADREDVLEDVGETCQEIERVKVSQRVC